ncbi:S24 family peptidase [Bosea sp. (in: a-proteobacteria)]|uniref:LexA family transcriptional regulator n=1 Tax=Bosea sp. (in: a-proteobacteria) TaxID=1871050 RepID=UPI001AC4E1F4|nr:S24 family peptidase [Bosea sp. (in: a-proteobacteria)]MBN9438944.1 helix-turn-helix transcriptional regulator [Bosea sp. (in: a-proteobacteria)]
MSKQLDDVDAEEVDAAFLQRFRDVVEAAGSRQKASDLTGNSTQQISKWMGGKARIPFRQAAILAKAANRSLDWLASGEGPPLLEHGATRSGAQPELKQLDDDDVVFVPLLEVIASAGPGIENSNPVAKDYLPFPRRWLEQLNLPPEFARFLDSRGDSMTETIKEDAICLADIRWQRPRLDAIFVVVHNNDVRIKRIGRGMEGRVTLISDNPRYETEVLSEPEARSLKIAGRVVWAGGKI